MAVLRPLKVVLDNYPEGQVEELEAVNNPEDAAAGTRKVPFSRELYIERDDFMEDPPKKFFRLAPGREVRLRYAYLITCREVIKDERGEVVELRCTYDPQTAAATRPTAARCKATLHWVSAAHAVPAEVRLYEHLFTRPDPGAEGDFIADLNPDSLQVLERLPPRAGSRRARARASRPVRASGLLLRRPRQHTRAPRLQPHGHAARHLGEAPGQGQARRVAIWSARLTGRRHEGERRRSAAPARGQLPGADRLRDGCCCCCR